MTSTKGFPEKSVCQVVTSRMAVENTSPSKVKPCWITLLKAEIVNENFSSQNQANSLSGDVLALEEHEAVPAEAGHDVVEVDLPLAVDARRPQGALARVVLHPG